MQWRVEQVQYGVHIFNKIMSVCQSLVTTATKKALLAIRRRNWFANLFTQLVKVVLGFQAEWMVFTKLGAVHCEEERGRGGGGINTQLIIKQ